MNACSPGCLGSARPCSAAAELLPSCRAWSAFGEITHGSSGNRPRAIRALTAAPGELFIRRFAILPSYFSSRRLFGSLLGSPGQERPSHESSMGLVVTCAACGQRLNISDRLFETRIRGRVVTVFCKKCQARIRVDGTRPGPENRDTLDGSGLMAGRSEPDELARSSSNPPVPSSEAEPVTQRAKGEGSALVEHPAAPGEGSRLDTGSAPTDLSPQANATPPPPPESVPSAPTLADVPRRAVQKPPPLPQRVPTAPAPTDLSPRAAQKPPPLPERVPAAPARTNLPARASQKALPLPERVSEQNAGLGVPLAERAVASLDGSDPEVSATPAHEPTLPTTRDVGGAKAAAPKPEQAKHSLSGSALLADTDAKLKHLGSSSAAPLASRSESATGPKAKPDPDRARSSPQAGEEAVTSSQRTEATERRLGVRKDEVTQPAAKDMIQTADPRSTMPTVPDLGVTGAGSFPALTEVASPPAITTVNAPDSSVPALASPSRPGGMDLASPPVTAPPRASGRLDQEDLDQNGSRSSGLIPALQQTSQQPSLAPVAVAPGAVAHHRGKSAWVTATIVGALAAAALVAFVVSPSREAQPRITREVASRLAKSPERLLTGTQGSVSSDGTALALENPAGRSPSDTSSAGPSKLENIQTVSVPRTRSTREVERAPGPLESRHTGEVVSPESSAASVESSDPSPPEPPEPTPPVVSAPVVLPPPPAVAPASIPKPRPAPASSGPQMLRSKIAHGRLAIDPNQDRYRVTLPPALGRSGHAFTATVRICVSEQGTVTGVTILKSAGPGLDPQIPSVLGRWRYRPWLEDGRAVPFCYSLRYEIGPR
jgi:hypothetical protein